MIRSMGRHGTWVVAAAAMCAGIVACARAGGGPSSLASGGSGGGVGYVDLDAVVAVHPLHSQLQAMQDQIAVLQQESTLVPSDMSPQQAAAYNRMQSELSTAEQAYQAQLAGRRAYYEQKESQALNQLQVSTLGAGAQSGGILSGLQQQYGAQAQAMQQQAVATLNTYRSELFKQDSEHLRSVQNLLAADVRGKLQQRQSQLSSAETKYQIELAKADQEQKLNLQAKLQNLALSDAERAQDAAALKALDSAEQSKIDAMKASDNSQMATYTKQLEAQGAAKYDAERKATQDATQAKLVARQKELQNQVRPQLVALNGKFQAQIADANQKLANNPKYQAQAQSVHDQMQSSYVAEADKATAAYQVTRQALVAKYSTIAHMQFQDNEAIAAQADKIAADRRDLYQKIVDQVQAQVNSIAQRDGIGVVFDNVRGAGSAVDLTPAVTKAIMALQTATAAPAASGGP